MNWRWSVYMWNSNCCNFKIKSLSWKLSSQSHYSNHLNLCAWYHALGVTAYSWTKRLPCHPSTYIYPNQSNMRPPNREWSEPSLTNTKPFSSSSLTPLGSNDIYQKHLEQVLRSLRVGLVGPPPVRPLEEKAPGGLIRIRLSWRLVVLPRCPWQCNC